MVTKILASLLPILFSGFFHTLIAQSGLASKGIKYLALGDSYTIGESVASKEKYPVQLVERLRQQKLEVDDPLVIATTGWTTEDLMVAIEAAELENQKFDLVSLLIGVNDQYQHKPFDHYEPNFRSLVDKAIELAGGKRERVFVLSIPDYAFTPFGQKKTPQQITEELDAYNRINKMVAQEYGISYFDITPISRDGLEKPELVAADGLHPSAIMYSLWVDLLVEPIVEKSRR